MNVLIIDDDQQIVELLREVFLVHFECQVETCNSVDGVDGYTRSKKYDLICCDYLMSPVKGDEIIKNIRTTHELNAKTPILMITAYPDFPRQTQDRIWDNVKIIKKPITLDDLLKEVSEIVSPTKDSE
jgi:DNA-binding NtrC family response regulator